MFVVDSSARARLRKVKVGVVTEGMMEIREGVKAGEQVVVVGQLNLRSGERVRIGNELQERTLEIVKSIADGTGKVD